MLLGESPRRQRVSRLVSWGHWFAFYNILVALVIASMYIFAEPLPESLLGQIYLVMNWLGHISFLTFMGFVIAIIPLCYLINNSRLVKGLSSTIAALGQAILAFDALLYHRTGLHISWQESELVVDETVQQVATFGTEQLLFFGLLFAVWLSFQLLIANAIWQRIDRFSRQRIEQSVIGIFLACFIGAHGLHIWADAKLYQPIVQQDNMFPLSYPATAKTTLSRYGLLDIEDYNQRKSIQFAFAIDALNYPTQPIYCPVAIDKPWLVFYATEHFTADSLPFSLNQAPYYRSSASPESQIKTMTYGLPNLYHQYLRTTNPVLFDLLFGFGIDVYMDVPADTYLATRNIRSFSLKETTEFSNAVYIIYSDALSISKALQGVDRESVNVLILSPSNDTQKLGFAYSTLSMNAALVLNEDIPATLMNSMGCNVASDIYSTGKPIQGEQRPWHVTTEDNRVVIFNDDSISYIESNGASYSVSSQTGALINQELNTQIFNRSMKHLSQFAR